MTQRNLLTLLIIAAVTVLSIILILPTVGMNELVVVLNDDANATQIEQLRKRFPDSRYKVSVEDKTLRIEGLGLNNAVMNEVLKKDEYPFVKEATISKHWAETVLLAKRINLGLDLQGGSMLVLQADYERMEKKMNRRLTEKDKNEITSQALDMIRDRIDVFGVSEPQIRTRGADQIELQLPGVSDPQAIEDALGMTGTVEYRLADDELSAKAKEALVTLKA
ncbi:MAG TPA: hypothetical protein PKK43_16045, partial [Spirochaetota bacterium]|nr:hypothetical protein [Spirochaetota bacterium]